MKDYRALYEAEQAKLQALADTQFTHAKHLCENLREQPYEIQTAVCKILNVQLGLLVKINRQTPLTMRKGF